MEAALDLFADPGFEQTTVADIAARAGVTERTFFRHFADKREVLFAGSNEFQAGVLAAIEGAPAGLSPLEAAETGMEAAAEFLQSRPDVDFPRRRAAAIAANRSLQERELLKLATVATESARALERRGASATEAAVAAEVAMAAFRLAFERWVTAPEALDLPALVRERVAAFRALT